MSTKSYSDLDPDMAELFRERDEHDRKQRELNNRPNLIRSLSHDDDAELITAIIPDEDGVSPPHSEEISKIWDEEGFDAAVKKARQRRKATQTSSNKGGRKKTRKRRKIKKRRKTRRRRYNRKTKKRKRRKRKKTRK